MRGLLIDMEYMLCDVGYLRDFVSAHNAEVVSIDDMNFDVASYLVPPPCRISG